MIVYFDTVRRKRPVREGGEIVSLDWDCKRVLARLPVFPDQPEIREDPNPRGNSRGGKGILTAPGEVLVGTYHSILLFDPELNPKGRITNPLFVNLHEMCWDGEDIWVSSTTIDAAVKVDRHGQTVATWWPREDSRLRRRFGLEPMPIDKRADNRLQFLHAELGQKPHHTHLNCISRWGDRTFALLNRLGALVQMEPETAVIVEDERLRGSHSARITPDGREIVICCSFHKSLVWYELSSGRRVRELDLLRFPEIQELGRRHPDQPFNRSIFVRGLSLVDSNRYLVGISPAAILEIDPEKERLTDLFQYSADVGDAVHGIAWTRHPDVADRR
jgi:hypothetical protein